MSEEKILQEDKGLTEEKDLKENANDPQQDPEETKPLKGRAANPGLYAVLDWVIVIAVAMAVALLINFFIIVNSTVPTGSMENTIMAGSRMLGFRTAYWFSEPKRGDIVVFKYPDDPSELFVKRIIGLPGETVEIIDGQTYIDGEPLEEDYINEDYWYTDTDSEDYGPYYVPEDSYFMMGDNRGNSKDSRKWTNKFVDRDAIVGKAWLVYWPFSDFGTLK